MIRTEPGAMYRVTIAFQTENIMLINVRPNADKAESDDSSDS